MSAISVSASGISSVVSMLTAQLSKSNVSAVPDIPSAAPASAAATEIGDPKREFVRVSSSIGRAATAGQLSREEAVDIYRQIASLL